MTPLFRPILLSLCLCGSLPSASSDLVIQVDTDRGPVRSLNGINGGPITMGGLVDLSAQHRAAAFPAVRLHDCQWPEPGVVDIHTVFRDFRDSPDDPASYRFERTDDYLAAVIRLGGRVIFRLGESIEHSARKYEVHPPRDPAKWAEVCAGIVRHYTAGWAEGFRHPIRDWEIWNEPDNRPAMWTGTDQQYFDLYEVTVRRLKREFPDHRVGGPGLGNTGDYRDGRLEPSPFLRGFLQFCRERRLPLDFFSWHCYTDDPGELAGRAREVRRLLDEAGFPRAESHLNEWNFLPNRDWTVFIRGTPRERTQWYRQVGGAAGAAFASGAMMELQDAPLDLACFFHGDIQGFGLFEGHGEPRPVYQAFLAMASLRAAGSRLEVRGALPDGWSAMASGGKDAGAMVFLVSQRREGRPLNVTWSRPPWPGPIFQEVVRVQASAADGEPGPAERTELRAGEPMTLSLSSEAPGMIWVRWAPQAASIPDGR